MESLFRIQKEGLRDYSKDIALQSWTKDVKETRRCMHEPIKENDGDIWLSQAKTVANVFEHASKTRHYPFWDEVKFIDLDPLCYSSRIEELYT